MECGGTQVRTYDDDVLEGHGTEIPGFAVELDRKNSRLESLTHCKKNSCQRMVQHHETRVEDGGEGIVMNPLSDLPKVSKALLSNSPVSSLP